jgi:hypothetical protein
VSTLTIDEFGTSFVCSRPLPHDCIITPRFPEVVSILAEERESFEG